jgi:hypothetical protein
MPQRLPNSQGVVLKAVVLLLFQMKFSISSKVLSVLVSSVYLLVSPLSSYTFDFV